MLAGSRNTGVRTMQTNELGLVNMIRSKLKWAGANQQVISDNIANANTPGYRAQRLEDFHFKRELRMQDRMQPQVTNKFHLAGSGGPGGVRTIEERAPYEISPTGNSVVMEQQMISMQQNNADYNVALNVYRKYKMMMQMAVRSQ